MRRLSIARSVQLALLSLALLLAVLAGIGIADLYRARQRYEDRTAATYALESNAAKLLAASVIEEATLRTALGPAGHAARARARAAFEAVAADTGRLAATDRSSARLVSEAVAQQAAVRSRRAATGAALAARAPITALSRLQVARRAAARATARSDSRRALIEIVIAGVAALVAILMLVSALIARMRQPLNELVSAARRLASGDLRARVRPSGPGELRTLATAFNSMADSLATAATRVEAERSRLDQTIQSLGDALLVVDADDTIAAANPRAARLLPELPAGAHLSSTSPLPPLERALAGEVTIDHGGRALAATAARVVGPDADGAEASSVVWTIRDVTERARLERLKSEFVATASHELRSPMTSIKGFVELLASSTGLNARQREFVEIILASTNRLVDLVNDLLDVARIEAGEAHIHPRAIDLAEVVAEVTRLMGPRLADKQQRLAIEIEPDLPRALADPSRVRQILNNLVTNAHLYTPERGHLGVELHAHNGMVALTVADNGPGMSDEQLQRIFDRFYRAGRAGDGVPGTGLGLAIVKSLVDMHKGRITVDSELGMGTRFTVLLPSAPDRAQTKAQAALAGRRVLVIDDEPSVARLIAAQLRPFGAECTIAASGAEGVQLLRQREFDAMTLDVLMPDMTGFDVLRELREDPTLADLPIVVVSVFSGGEALAGEWVVSKPIDAEELAEALGSAVLSRRVRVLAVSRRGVREQVEAALAEVGIEYVWACTVAEVKSQCARFHFEAALIDAGLRSPAAVIEALELRGQRLERAVVVFAVDPAAPGLARLDAEPVPIDRAGAAVAELLGVRVNG